MKLNHALWGHPRWAGMVERSDRMWSTGEGNGAARWLARRRTLGPLSTLAHDPILRLFEEIASALQSPDPKATPSLLLDWQTFG